MKRFIYSLVALLCIAGEAYAQIPKLKPVRDLDEQILPSEKKGKWGYASNHGKMVISAVFDFAEPFAPVTSADGTTMQLARIKVGSSWGYITREGVYLIEPVYDTISRFDRFATVVAESGPFKTLIGVRTATSPNLGIPVLASNLLQMNLAELGEFTDEGLAWASKSGKWGQLDYQGKWALPCDYTLEEADAGLLLLSKDGKYGLATLDGHIVLPVEYDGIFFKPDLNAFAISRDGLYGLIKPDGSSILDVVFADIVYYPGLLVVEKDGLRAAYSPDGNQLLAFGPWTVDAYELLSKGYDSVIWDDELGAFRTFKDGLMGMTTGNGEYIIDPEYDNIVSQPYGYLISKNGENAAFSKDLMYIAGWGPWTADLAALKEEYEMVAYDSNYGFMVMKDGKFGVVDKDGVLLIPAIYKKFFWNYDKDWFEAVLEDGSTIYFDALGRQLQPEEAAPAAPESKSASEFVIVSDGIKYGIADRKGEILVPIRFDKIEEKPYGYLFTDDGLHATMDKDLMWTLGWGPWTADITEFSENYEYYYWGLLYGFIVKKDEKWGSFTLSGKPFLPVIYDCLSWDDVLNCYSAVLDDETFLIDSKGNRLAEGARTDPYEALDFEIVSDGEKYGMVNRYGEVVLPILYDSVVNKAYGYLASRNGMNTAFDYELKYLVEPGPWTADYDVLRQAYNEVFWDKSYGFWVKKGDKIGALNMDGSVLIPVICDSLRRNVETNCFDAVINGVPVNFDINGNQIIP